MSENFEKLSKLGPSDKPEDYNDVFSVSEEELLETGDKNIENHKSIRETLRFAGAEEDKIEGLSDMFQSNETLNKVRNLQSLSGLKSLEDWKFLTKEAKRDIIEKLNLKLPQNIMSKLAFKFIPNEENKWLDDVFYSHVAGITHEYKHLADRLKKDKS